MAQTSEVADIYIGPVDRLAIHTLLFPLLGAAQSCGEGDPIVAENRIEAEPDPG